MEDSTLLYIPVSEDLSTNLEGLIAAFVNKWSKSRTKQNLVSNLGKSTNENQTRIPVNLDGTVGTLAPTEVTLPSLTLKANEDLSECTVAGLAAVCRHLIRHAGIKDPAVNHALGFRQNCLQAPAEVSVWTAFCEVRMPADVDKFLAARVHRKQITIPLALAQFESHLKCPIRVHNIVKRWQETSQTKTIVGADEMKEIQKMAPTWIAHTFAEGPDMTLADLLLYPCTQLAAEYLQTMGFNLKDHLPTVSKWLDTMNQIDSVVTAWTSTIGPLNFQSPWSDLDTLIVDVPNVSQGSLYKKDPSRQSVPNLSSQDVESTVQLLKNRNLWPGELSSIDLPPQIDLELEHEGENNGFSSRIDWSSLPDAAHPEQGRIPGSRLERKIQQLDNVGRAVMDCVEDGDVIVDFCSGGGHLGIVLAHVLPACRVIMIDNKEESVRQARRRVAQLKLFNIQVIQSNLDYFQGDFQLGVALHACGVATDLVLHNCLSKKASFVLCPCCYGNLALSGPIVYPQSRWLIERSVTASDFSVLARVADHPTDRLTGRCSMAVVDLDRMALAAQDGAGYKVVLKKLQPDSCTPKHNLLIGRVLHIPRKESNIDS